MQSDEWERGPGGKHGEVWAVVPASQWLVSLSNGKVVSRVRGGERGEGQPAVLTRNQAAWKGPYQTMSSTSDITLCTGRTIDRNIRLMGDSWLQTGCHKTYYIKNSGWILWLVLTNPHTTFWRFSDSWAWGTLQYILYTKTNIWLTDIK